MNEMKSYVPTTLQSMYAESSHMQSVVTKILVRHSTLCLPDGIEMWTLYWSLNSACRTSSKYHEYSVSLGGLSYEQLNQTLDGFVRTISLLASHRDPFSATRLMFGHSERLHIHVLLLQCSSVCPQTPVPSRLPSTRRGDIPFFTSANLVLDLATGGMQG